MLVLLLTCHQSTVSCFSGVVMVGPGFAVNSEYFREIGTYDEGMKIWGGENLELAWRVMQKLKQT